MRSIHEIENELIVIRRLDDRNSDAVYASERPRVERVFLASSNKRRRLLERELMEAKAERAHEIFSLKLHTPQFGPGTIPLRLLAKLANLLNDVIEQTSWREWDIDGNADSISDDFRRLINLRLAGIQSGSTDLIMLGNTAPDLTGESALESGLRNVFEILSAKNEHIPDLINGIGTHAAHSVIKLMKAFEAEHMGVELSWRGPESKYHWDGRPDQITRVRFLLEEFGEPHTVSTVVQGVVSALTRKKIQIEVEDGRRIGARYHRSKSEKVNSLHLDQVCEFELEVTTYPSDATGIKQDAYRLLDVCPKKV